MTLEVSVQPTWQCENVKIHFLGLALAFRFGPTKGQNTLNRFSYLPVNGDGKFRLKNGFEGNKLQVSLAAYKTFKILLGREV